MKLDSVRREYKFAELSRKSVQKDPFKQFEIWIKDAINSKVNEPTAMTVSTVDKNGFPQSRIVLLKDYNSEGLTFFTDYNGEKGKTLLNNPKIGVNFFWSELERQIRVTGLARKTSDKVSDIYFKSRPVTSQIAAIVSRQSEEIPSREYLENCFFDLQDELHGKTPNRPESWGGFIIEPISFEFWQGRESRLHDRIVYELQEDQWITKRLAP